MDSTKASEQAKKRVSSIKAKIEKISIAPGEYGAFKNWGEDLYIEEKCFPHLFPYGIGGYMSSALDGKNTELGFTNYVRHRILHVDSRFRKDPIYFFSPTSKENG